MIRFLAHFRSSGGSLLLAVLFGLLFAAPASAQSVRDVIVDQSSVLQRYEPPLRRPPTLGITLADDVVGVPDAELARVRFVFRGVDIVGADSIDQALLTPLFAGLVGREITLLDLRTAVAGIEDVYRDNDYFAGAVVPPQDFAGGVVRVIVYESFIRDVVLKGDVEGVRNLRERLQPYIDKMVEMRPVRISRVIRYALLMTDLAGLTINAEFSRIVEDPGAGLLVLTIDFSPRALRARLDNFASTDVGPLELAGSARFNNAFGFFEWTEGLAVTNPLNPEELVVARLSQHVPLGPSGFATGYEYARIWSNPEDDENDIHAETTQANVYLNYAVLRSIERNVIAALTLSGQDTAVDVDGNPVVRQRKRWASIGATYDDTILGVAAITHVAYAHGIDGLDASGENNDFSFASADGQLSKDLTDTVSAQFQFTGQYAFNDLPSAVNFSLGGETFGRAFENGAIAGQSGYAVAFELGKKLDFGIDWLTALTLFGFVDYGAVYNPPDRGPYEFASLGAAGAGFRAFLGRHTMISTWVAIPYKDEPEFGAEGTTVRFNAGMQF